MMQAFAYWHLVQSEDLMVMVPRSAYFSPTLDMTAGRAAANTRRRLRDGLIFDESAPCQTLLSIWSSAIRLPV